jgi:hypothetical protein
MPSISHETVVARSHRQAHCVLGDRAVLMDVETGEYFELNPVASRMWLAMASPIPVAKLIEALLVEYDVEKATCEEEVLEWLEEMIRLKFVEMSSLESSS